MTLLSLPRVLNVTMSYKYDPKFGISNDCDILLDILYLK